MLGRAVEYLYSCVHWKLHLRNFLQPKSRPPLHRSSAVREVPETCQQACTQLISLQAGLVALSVQALAWTCRERHKYQSQESLLCVTCLPPFLGRCWQFAETLYEIIFTWLTRVALTVTHFSVMPVAGHKWDSAAFLTATGSSSKPQWYFSLPSNWLCLMLHWCTERQSHFCFPLNNLYSKTLCLGLVNIYRAVGLSLVSADPCRGVLGPRKNWKVACAHSRHNDARRCCHRTIQRQHFQEVEIFSAVGL